ncbi:CAP domain-containing protein [Streptomyces chiangmaiensis]|uniref:CAP domain-containing protein n=1 Tax=Streptomyces chiangmaiensis TaxID=766497 RepID=A0ABU7FJ74_9ACTN|nr:CAP domain-containing protein [Streptomyces chiangmaiensis]MED7824026.1 CAP domain-containing protein [Streptomyces chiangmaiensis]
MGRHRRTAAGRAATGGRATEVTQRHHIPTEDYGPENLYGFAAVLEAERRATRSHRKKKATTPVRTGLLGVSAAVALGTVAVAAGVLPGAEHFTVSGDSGDPQAGGAAPSGFATEQGGTSGTADDRESTSTSRHDNRAAAPTTAPPSATAAPSTPAEKPSKTPSATATKTATAAPPAHKETTKPQTTHPAKVSTEGAAAAAVLKLVNDERAKVGCSPVTPNGPLRKLAEAFSEDMAARSFFDHTDPSGKDPWDRAAGLGITDLGGENIARGQATAQEVVDAWMNSPGHRANILNCDFQTLGVGVHFGVGGPWWTQDFGY